MKLVGSFISFIIPVPVTFLRYWAITEKKAKEGGSEQNLQGYQKNSMWNLQGLIKNEMEFPRKMTKGKIMWNFQGS